MLNPKKVQNFEDFTLSIEAVQEKLWKDLLSLKRKYSVSQELLDPHIVKLFKNFYKESFIQIVIDTMQQKDVFPSLYNKWRSITHEQWLGKGKSLLMEDQDKDKERMKSILKTQAQSQNYEDVLDLIVSIDKECMEHSKTVTSNMQNIAYNECIFPKKVAYHNRRMKKQMEEMKYKWMGLTGMIKELDQLCPIDSYITKCMHSIQTSWNNIANFMDNVLDEYLLWFKDKEGRHPDANRHIFDRKGPERKLVLRAKRQLGPNDEYVYLISVLSLFCSLFFEMVNIIHCVFRSFNERQKNNVKCIDHLSKLVIYCLTVLYENCLPNKDVFNNETMHLRLGYEKIKKLLEESLKEIKEQSKPLKSPINWGACYFDCMNKWENKTKCTTKCNKRRIF